MLRTEELADLGVKITVLQTPEGMSASRGLKKLRKLDPEGTYDFNHVYLDERREYGAHGPAGAGRRTYRRRRRRACASDSSTAASMRNHVSLRANIVHAVGCDGAPVPSAHGTAVASLLAGSSGSFHGAAPRAELFAVDVYCGRPTGGAVDSVAAAFGWMARYRVAVINVSLVGPRNALLERVVASLVSRGHLIVAAVGNDGPAAAPLFPAAYDGVVAVTAVDQRHRVLIEACRGKHLDVAAPRRGPVRGRVGSAGALRRGARHVVRRAHRGGPAGARACREPDAAARDRVRRSTAGGRRGSRAARA